MSARRQIVVAIVSLAVGVAIGLALSGKPPGRQEREAVEWEGGEVTVRRGKDQAVILRPHVVWRDGASAKVGDQPREDAEVWTITLSGGRTVIGATAVE